MMKIKLMAAAAVAALTAATGASAHTPGFYAAADFGYHWPYDYVGKSNVTGAEWRFRGDDDWVGFGRLGYGFGGGSAHPQWRLELEGGYRPSDVNRVFRDAGPLVPSGLCTAGVTRTVAAPACGALNGELNVKTAMVNAIYEIMPDSRVRPFIGVGGGVSWSRLQVIGQLAEAPAGTRPYQNLRAA